MFFFANLNKNPAVIICAAGFSGKNWLIFANRIGYLFLLAASSGAITSSGIASDGGK